MRKLLLTSILFAAFGATACAQVPGGSGHGAKLTWTASTGATGYNVYRSSVGATGPFVVLNTTGPVSTTGFSDTNVTKSTAYWWCVTAVAGSFESACSSVVTATIPGDATAPPIGVVISPF